MSDCQLVLLRHGESAWNRKGLFTGWRDSKLTERGEGEARAAGRLLAAEGFGFDLAATSLQTRAIKTLWLALEEMDLMWIEALKHWRLNERHYGALQGTGKEAAARRFGEAKVFAWRRSFLARPPLAPRGGPNDPRNDPRYADVPARQLPRGECLKDVLARIMPYWQGVIAPRLRAGERVLIVAHGNSLRALVKHLENVSDAAIAEMTLPTGLPKAYRLNSALRAKDAFFVGRPADVERKIKSAKTRSHRND
jgi:2,3-bisphosphoglycerate-dependent phosphoglycerate mutase